MSKFKEVFNEKTFKLVSETFHFIADMSVLFSKHHLKFPQPTGPNYLIDNFIKLYDTFMRDWCVEGATVPGDAEDKALNALIFSCLWAIGGQSDEHTRGSYDVFM